MIDFFKKPFVYAIIFAIILTGFNIYVLLKTFVISEVVEIVDISENEENIEAVDIADDTDFNSTETEENNVKSIEPTITESSYEDENISITIETIYKNDTYIYIADVQVSSAEYLKTALANDSFGTNVTQATSEIAESKNAILAINGDYYGANKKGYVIKNGVIYRDTVRSDIEYDDLVIYEDGSFGIVNETNVSAKELLESGVVQTFAFGPTLVYNSEIVVSQNDEVAKSKTENPRTAIGIIDDLHYIFLVSDGRTDESEGLSLYQVAEVMNDYGCTLAYNLDGGGSSTLYFNGRVINNPTTSGKTIKERSVSDIVYIGY